MRVALRLIVTFLVGARCFVFDCCVFGLANSILCLLVTLLVGARCFVFDCHVFGWCALFCV